MRFVCITTDGYNICTSLRWDIWKKKFKEIRYDKNTLDEFKAKVGKPIQNEWVAANKDQFDAQAVLDVILNYK